jgi:hypothetical protein
MALFGNKQDKAAQDAAAQAEAARLVGLPAASLAAEVLPAFGPDGPGNGEKGIGTLTVAMFLMADFPRGNLVVKQLLDPIREAFLALENAGLILEHVQNIGGSVVSITRAGADALASGTVAERLQ